MRIAIVDDLAAERALLKDRLEQQLHRRNVQADILEYESGETFLEAARKAPFTAAFLDIYMDGMTGMEAAKKLRKTNTDCLLVFTTTSTDHALEGFQVRALHYLVKPFTEADIDALTDELLARIPQPDKYMELKVEGSEIHLRYQDIVYAEHFAHLIYVHTTVQKTLATRQPFKTFIAPLKDDTRFFVCGRGVIVNLEHAKDLEGTAFRMAGGSRVFVRTGPSEKRPAGAYGVLASKGADGIMELLRPILELGVVIPGMLLAYFPAKSSLKQPLSKLVLWLVPLLALLCAAGGVVCYARRMPTAPMLAGLTLLAVVIYIKTLRISLWKSGTIALSVCAVFACINSLSRAINAAMLAGLPQAQAAPWFCLRSAICYHAICWLFAAIAYYPATHSVRRMVEDENFAQTWYVFWVLPLVFIALNLFMIPKYADTLYTGRVLQGYFVISIALLFLMLFFNAIFLLMAISINRNVRLQQENQLLSMQQQRYESLKAAIEEARQARHDLRHQLCQLAALAEEGNLEKIKAYLSSAVSRIPSFEMHFCENRAADSVVGYYCALAKRENIPYSVQIDLPECLPVDEINLCLVLSNLLENALEASLRTAPARRKIKLTAYLHSGSLALIQVENTYDGVIREKDGVFQSSKRKGDGVGLQSVRHIAEKSGGVSTVTYQDGVFRARVMLRG